jgi:hypothetical protein
MLKRFYRISAVLAVSFAFIAYAPSVRAQESSRSNTRDQQQTSGTDEQRSAQPGERLTTGTVRSVGRGSIVVTTDEGRYEVFSLDRRLVGLPPVEPGNRVRVITSSDDNDTAPNVLGIEQLPPRQGLAPQTGGPIPAGVQRITSEIERQAKRYRAGVFAGAALDPEMISLNAFATFTPRPQPRFAIRPAVEFAFGELTTLLGLNIDVLYSLPGVRPLARWAPYIGAGPNFSFSHRGVDEQQFISDPDAPQIDDDRFDFSQWDWNNGLNFVVGARNPGGTFLELKATAYGTASIRMLGGLEF